MVHSQPTGADPSIERDLLAAQSEIIELIAAGTSLPDTLNRIAAQVERLAAPAMCSILLLESDQLHMRLAAAPSLPPAYNQAIDGLAIGPLAGSCGTAMHRRAAVIVRDIASDPLWADHRDLALGHGLRACWSQPIIDDSGAVLGAFALYHRAPREPRPDEWRTVEIMSRLVRVALIPHRREDALREQLHFMQQLLDAIPNPIFYKDTAGAYLGGNAAFERTLGLRAADFVGRTVHAVVPKESAGTFHAADQELLRRPGVQVYEAQIRLPDGTPRDMLFHKATFLRPDNSVGGLVGVLIDITERKRVEREMRRAKEDAEMASRAKSQFLANMSHELRTPLNAILGFSEVIRDRLMGDDTPRYREYAADIHRAGDHLLNLINDVLDLSKIEVGRLALNEERVHVADLVESCCRLLDARAREGGVALDRHVPAGLPDIHGDPLRLKQIVLNILSNAVKFTPANGRVTVSAGVTAARDLLLSVADTGIGMAAQDIPVALAPFRQVEDALNRRFEGTGLGLPLAKTLTELHGGTLEIESAPGRGTTVRITLPAARLLAAAAHAP